MQTLTPAMYRRLQAELGLPAQVLTLDLMSKFVDEEVTREMLIEVASRVAPVIDIQRAGAAQLGRDFYETERAKNLTAVQRAAEPLPVTPIERYDPLYLVKGLEAFAQPGKKFAAPVESSFLAARHVKTASRRAITGLTLVDGDVKGWARSSGGTTSCSFCLMLIGRGPVYRTRQSAGDMMRYHNRCDCIVVPVFNKNRFPGRSEWLDASDMWSQATVGKTGKGALMAFRSHVRELNKNKADAARAA